MSDMADALGVKEANTVVAAKFSKVWNLPNILTYGRIVAVPAVAGLMLWGTIDARWIAFAFYVLAAITDFFDGYLARAWQQQSSLGRMLDPIADKVLVSVVLLVLCEEGTLVGGHIWAAVIILSREVLVSGLREYLGELRVSVPVTKIAKWKTAVQLFAIGFLIAGPAGDSLWPNVALPNIAVLGFILQGGIVTQTGIVLLWIAAALTLYTGYDYFRAGIRHVVD
jgi:CDP-diacylglycerol--glycerol-3-phosphate 3-phosphatidyltransferase